jgi:hypothetical protein
MRSASMCKTALLNTTLRYVQNIADTPSAHCLRSAHQIWTRTDAMTTRTFAYCRTAASAQSDAERIDISVSEVVRERNIAATGASLCAPQG